MCSGFFGLLFWANMDDEDSVVFRLSPPVGNEKTALTWFVGILKTQ